MALDEQHRKAVEQFIQLLLPSHMVLFRSVRDCMLKVTEDGHTLPIQAVGAAMALLTYQVVRRLQECLKGSEQKLTDADIMGVFIDSVTNLISCDYGLVTVTVSHEQLALLRSLVYERREDAVAKSLLGILAHAEDTWAAMQQRRTELEQIAKEAAKVQLQ